MLAGERVALGPLRKDLADRYRRWVHDLDVRNGILTVGIYSLEAEEDWVLETSAKCGGAAPEIAAFTVYDLSDGAPIGTTSLMRIDWRLSRSLHPNAGAARAIATAIASRLADRSATIGIGHANRKGSGD